MISLYAGLTSQTIDVFLQDSSSATGDGLAGLVFNSSNLTAYYRKGATGSATAITLATQTVGGAWSSGGFIEIDAVSMKGVYRLDIPNAAIDSEGFVSLFIRGATNLLSTPIRIDCRPLPVDLKKILGATITGDAAQIVAAFTKFFNVATPTGTVNSLPNFAPGVEHGLPVLSDALTVDAELDTATQAQIDGIENSSAAAVTKLDTLSALLATQVIQAY